MTHPPRIGLIGAGRWGKAYLRTLATLDPHCRLTHLCTSQPVNAGLVPYPVTVTSSWREVIHADCDLIILATPPSLHAEMLEACLAARTPCLVEKPLCLDLPTAERLHQRVESSGIPVLVNHIHLFNPYYHALRRAMAATQERVQAVLSEGMALGPFRPDVATLWDWCPQDLSLCLDVFGEEPHDVRALGASAQAPDLVNLRLDFSEGRWAWIQAGRLAPQKRRSLHVFTERHRYHWEDTVPQLTVTPFAFATRYHPEHPPTLTTTRLDPASPKMPLASVLLYALQGLAGGDRQQFGTAMALRVVRWLARAETLLRDQAQPAAAPS